MATPDKKKTAAVIAAAVAIAAPLVMQREGKSNDPYPDLGNVMTVCYGETQVAMHHYTDAECQQLLRDHLGNYAAPVLARNPELADRPEQLAAATSLAYNIGVGNYDKSRTARLFSAHDWRGACDAFRSWVYVGKQRVQGLANRREAERALCLKGAG